MCKIVTNFFNCVFIAAKIQEAFLCLLQSIYGWYRKYGDSSSPSGDCFDNVEDKVVGIDLVDDAIHYPQVEVPTIM